MKLSACTIGYIYCGDPRIGTNTHGELLLQGFQELGMRVRPIRSLQDDIGDCDILHFEMGGSLCHTFIWQLFKRFSRLANRPRLVATIHELSLQGIAYGARQNLYSRAKTRFMFKLFWRFGLRANLPIRFLLKQADAGIVLSEYLRSYLHMLAPNKVYRAHPPVPDQLRWDRPDRGDSLQLYVPGYMNLLKAPGILDLLEALAQTDFPTTITLNAHMPQPGDAVGLQAVMARARGLSDRVNIISTGFLEEDRYRDCFRSTNLIYVPRRKTNGEVSGPMYYALAGGIPVLLPNVDAFPEVQRDGHPWFYQPGDIPSIRAQLSWIWQNYAQASALSSQKGEYWRKRCSPRSVALQYLDVYAAL